MSRNSLATNWNEFKARFGTSKTTNFDLMDIGRRLRIPDFRVVMHDELPSLPRNARNIIMNLDSSENQGTHWVGIYNTPEYKLYFSSFGDPPSDRTTRFMDKTTTIHTVREYNDFQMQEFGAEYCGQISVYVIYRLNFTDDRANDIVLSLMNTSLSVKE